MAQTANALSPISAAFGVLIYPLTNKFEKQTDFLELAVKSSLLHSHLTTTFRATTMEKLEPQTQQALTEAVSALRQGNPDETIRICESYLLTSPSSIPHLQLWAHALIKKKPAGSRTGKN